MSQETIKASKGTEVRIFSKIEWDLMPKSKYGWKLVSDVPEEVLAMQGAGLPGLNEEQLKEAKAALDAKQAELAAKEDALAQRESILSQKEQSHEQSHKDLQAKIAQYEKDLADFNAKQAELAASNGEGQDGKARGKKA